MTAKMKPDKFSNRIANALNFGHRRRIKNFLPHDEDIAKENIYARTLSFLSGRDFNSALAATTWNRIHDHWQKLNNALDRDVGFFVAALDYFENMEKGREVRYVFMEETRFKSLYEQSTLDGMTLLFNHQTFIMMLEKELEFARRKHTPLTLLMADIDNFKRINDQRGHQHGDRVLIQVARILKQHLRAMDIAGRYGGEEFIVAFPDTDSKMAIEIAERIRRRIEFTYENDDRITVSMGMVNYPQVNGSIHDLIESADQALYQAKHEGKNQLNQYEP